MKVTVIKVVWELGLDPEVTIGIPPNGPLFIPGDVLSLFPAPDGSWAIEGPGEAEGATEGQERASESKKTVWCPVCRTHRQMGEVV